MRIPIIAGNWKMNLSIKEGVKFIDDIKNVIKDTDVEVLICAPFTMLKDLKKAAEGTNVKIGAQNMHFKDSGAFTGEVSAPMLREIGMDYVIIGHSERRQYFAETDETVNKKLIQAFKYEINPILCVGESEAQRESGRTESVIKEQITKDLANLSTDDLKKLVIAYEPIWAIGTGKTATAQQAQDTIAYIRRTVKSLYDEDTAETVRIQYGGSVKPANVEEIMNMDDIDGALVGGASLKVKDFIELVNF